MPLRHECFVADTLLRYVYFHDAPLDAPLRHIDARER